MHDLDRAMFEAERESELSGEWEQSEQEDFLGVLGSLLGESHLPGSQETPELHEFHELLGGELHGETHAETHGGELHGGAASGAEMQEVELAAELLEVTSEEELDRFLGNLLSGATRAASNFARSDTGRALGGVLRSAAKQALPIVGRGIGGTLGGAEGAKWGGRVGAAAGDLFGLELEGLSSEDREFEIARAFVRFARAACRNAAAAPPTAPPEAVARAAITAAARRYAPGLLRAVGQATTGGPGATTRARPVGVSAARADGAAPASNGRRQTGRWIRRDGAIVILGA